MDRKSHLFRNTLIGFVASLGLATLKLIAGLFGRSTALIADAIESVADSLSSIIVWKAIQFSDRPPDPDFPYGYGRAEALASLSVGGMLFVAGGYIVIRSFHEIITPHDPPSTWVLPLIAIVVVIKELLFRLTLRGATKFESDAAHADAWHHRSDAITSVAAFVGVAVAIYGPKIFDLPSLVVADELAALLSSGIIFLTATMLVRPAIKELLDATSPELVEKIRDVVTKIEGIDDVEKVFVRKSGPQFFADIHLHVHPAMTVLVSHNLSGKAKAELKKVLPELAGVLIHIEPKLEKPS